MKELSVSRLSGAGESVLHRVQEHPDLSRRRPGENARKYAAAAPVGVALFDARILHVASAIKRQLVVRVYGGQLAVKVSARRARLNPEIHSKRDNPPRFRLGKLQCCLGRRHRAPAASPNGLPDDVIAALRRDADVSLEHATGSRHHTCLDSFIAFCFFESHGAPRKVDWRIVARCLSAMLVAPLDRPALRRLDSVRVGGIVAKVTRYLSKRISRRPLLPSAL
jgi:hypothetical protein